VDRGVTRQQPATASVRLPGAATLADGEKRGVWAGGRNYVVARVGDDRYACLNRCPHLGIRLSGGRLDGSILECRWHHWRLDLDTGAIDAAESPFATFETYDVTVDGDDLVIAGEPKTRLRRLPPAEMATADGSPSMARRSEESGEM
jgi:nitrite reductase/ring-hydroxylating ferredoxin subunit